MCDCSQFSGRARDLCDGVGRDGRPDPQQKAVEAWRRRNCQRLSVRDGSPHFRGLGDVVAAVTRVTGIDRAVAAVTGKGCGCKRRQEKLNEIFPFGGQANG